MNKKNILRIKNSQTYIYSPEPNTGGENKDFSNGNDTAFAKHKAELSTQEKLIANWSP
ncbi:hypothetical protein [Xenorhabdus cabanillasii]|uniref:hypothetical protein n=1 Tax=Xenorhabdus cabanillasii TaxID=351673 RepID=UPI000C066377|nr:hypothetical protein [Xenorhabdus cabanillasii]PHM75443.1 hypothetical protein Xcab_04085 [Xenorhabdus cabanillasii JM26]